VVCACAAARETDDEHAVWRIAVIIDTAEDGPSFRIIFLTEGNRAEMRGLRMA
jgi:hypothetical protein